MSNWQPMETAPKDGTQILVTRQGRYRLETWIAYWYESEYISGKGWRTSDGEFIHWVEPDATHWHPLPPAPKEEPTREEIEARSMLLRPEYRDEYLADAALAPYRSRGGEGEKTITLSEATALRASKNAELAKRDPFVRVGRSLCAACGTLFCGPNEKRCVREDCPGMDERKIVDDPAPSGAAKEGE